jgi:hypothetical protein
VRRRGDHSTEPVESTKSPWPVWAAALANVRAALESGASDHESTVPVALDAVAARSAHAHGRLLRVLEGRTTAAEDSAEALTGEASGLLLAVAEVLRLQGGRSDPRGHILGTLEGNLRGHEADVLAGEMTYELAARDAQAPAARTRRALALLRGSDSSGHADLLSLQVAAVDLAALLVRAAGNLATANRADAAVERAAIAAPQPLRAMALEIASRAEQLQRADDRVDPGAGPLCAALRVAVSIPAPEKLTSSGRSQSAGSVVRERARAAWFSLAAHEHRAVAAIDVEMSEPAYAPRFPTLNDAVIEGAANILHNGHLLERPAAFRHGKAWSSHAVALSHAIEAYVRAVRGEEEGFARVQLIVLTRLVRAAAAIAILDSATTSPHPARHASRGARHD